jgi:hypothetical protein
MEKIAVVGAGGKMGFRIAKQIKDDPNYSVKYVENAHQGIARLKEIGVSVVPLAEAAKDTDMLVLAIPDRLIKILGREIIPLMPAGAIVICLDPAAAYAGVLPERKDIAYFVAHPCHPPLFGFEADPAARNDWFGTIAKQSIVCAIHQGSDEDYRKGETLAKTMWRPVTNAYRINVEQMAILEPALVETFNTAMVAAMKMMLDRTIELGVPKDAAEAFFWGHVRTSFGIIFGYSGFPMSDGAMLAMKQGMEILFKPGWMDAIMNIENVRTSVKQITESL